MSKQSSYINLDDLLCCSCENWQRGLLQQCVGRAVGNVVEISLPPIHTDHLFAPRHITSCIGHLEITDI